MPTNPFDQRTQESTPGRYHRGRRMFGGRYTLIRQLGRGGMGEVWLAQDNELAVERCLKFAPAEIAADAKSVAILKREAIAGTSLAHPHIVRIFDFVYDATDQQSAVVMEVVEGKSLADLQAERIESTGNGFFEPDEIEEWVKEACVGLDYAHGEKRVHRDIKPQNLLIEHKTGRLKIADFGISRRIGDSMSQLTGKDSSGTMPYMSPQQMMGEDQASVQDDVYGLGATVYDLLTGSPPFIGGSLEVQIQEKTPPSMMERRKTLQMQGGQSSVGKPIPAFWETAVQRCLLKDATKRPGSLSTAFSPAAAVSTPKGTGRGWKVAAAFILGFLALGAGGFGLREVWKSSDQNKLTREESDPKKSTTSQPHSGPLASSVNGSTTVASAAEPPVEKGKELTNNLAPAPASAKEAAASTPPPVEPTAVPLAAKVGEPKPFDVSTLSDSELKQKKLYPIFAQARFETDPRDVLNFESFECVKCFGMGLCDEKGNIILPPTWDNRDSLNGQVQLMYAWKNGEQLLIDRKGKAFLPEIKADSYDFSEDGTRVIVTCDEFGMGLYHVDGRSIFPMAEGQGLLINEENAIICGMVEKAKAELLDANGISLAEIDKNSDIAFFGNGLLIENKGSESKPEIGIQDSRTGLVLKSAQSKPVIRSVQRIGETKERLILASTQSLDSDTGNDRRYAICKPDGTALTPEIWTDAFVLKGKYPLIHARNSNQSQILDLSGNVIAEGNWSHVSRVSDDFVALESGDFRKSLPLQILDVKTRELLELKNWAKFYVTENGLIHVAKENADGERIESVIDVHGKVVFGGKWKDIKILTEDTFIARFSEGSKVSGPRTVLVKLREGNEIISEPWHGIARNKDHLMLHRLDAELNLTVAVATEEGNLIWEKTFPSNEPFHYTVKNHTFDLTLVRDKAIKDIPNLSNPDFSEVKLVELGKEKSKLDNTSWNTANSDTYHSCRRQIITNQEIQEARENGKDIIPAEIMQHKPMHSFSSLAGGSFTSYEGGILLEMDQDTEKVLWGTKLEWITDEEITWINKTEGILYVATTSMDTIDTGSNSEPTLTPTERAKYSGPLGQMAAIRLSDKKLLWKTPQGVCNSFNFLVSGDYIICGFGGTQLEDYVRVLDRHTGWELAKHQVSSMPKFFTMNNNLLFVRCFDADYKFGLGKDSKISPPPPSPTRSR